MIEKMIKSIESAEWLKTISFAFNTSWKLIAISVNTINIAKNSNINLSSIASANSNANLQMNWVNVVANKTNLNS